MKPKFDHKIIRPGGKIFDMRSPTDLWPKFEKIIREQKKLAEETAKVVRPITKKKSA